MRISSSLAGRVFAAGAIVTLSSIVVRAANLLASPWITRLYPPEAYGESTSLIATISIFATLAVSVVDMGYMRLGNATDIDRNVAEQFYWRLGLLGACGSILVAALVWHFALAGTLGLVPWLGVPLVLGIAGNVICSLATTRQRLKGGYGRVATAIGAGGLGTIAWTLAAGYFWRRDAWPLVIAFVAGLAIQLAILGTPRIGSLVHRPNLPKGFVRTALQLGLPTLVSMPAYWVITSSDRWFLVRLAGQWSAGVYSIAVGIGMIGLVANSAVQLAWFPELGRIVDTEGDRAKAGVGRVWARLSVVLGIVWVALCASGGEALRMLTGPAYHSGATVVPWIATATLMYGLAQLANTGMFVSKQALPSIGWWAIGAATSIVLNLSLVGRFGFHASAWAMTAAFSVTAAGTFYSSHRRWPMTLPLRALAGAWGVLVLGAAILSRGWASHPLLSLALKCPVGALVAVVAVRVVAPDWFARGLQKLKLTKP